MLATAVGCCELGRAGDSRGGTPSQSRGQRPYVLLQFSTPAFAGDGGGCFHPEEGMGPLQAPKY